MLPRISPLNYLLNGAGNEAFVRGRLQTWRFEKLFERR